MTQTIRLADRAGLIKLRHVATDGTRVKAYASKHKAMSYARMKQEEERLRRDIEAYLEQVEANDRAEDTAYGDQSGWRLPPELADREKRLETIREAEAHLEAQAKERRAREQAQRREAANGVRSSRPVAGSRTTRRPAT